MLVQEYVKKYRIFKKVKPKKDLMYQDIKTYIIVYVKTKKKYFIIHYVKPTAQLLFKIRFPWRDSFHIIGHLWGNPPLTGEFP